MKTLDQVYLNEVGIGRFQYISLAIVSLIDFSDGIEKTLVGSLVKVYEKQFNLNDTSMSVLASIYYVGIVLGTLFCAFAADKIGRARLLQYSSLLALLLLLWNVIISTFTELLVVRLLFGFVFGTTIPIGHVLISEIVTADIRGKMSAIISAVFIIGKIYCTLLQLLLLDDFQSGQWRLLLLVNAAPFLLCCITSFIYLRDSPRFYMSLQLYDKAFEEIEFMAKINKRQTQILDEDTKADLINQQKQINEVQTQKISIIYLLSKQYRSFSLRIWVVFILTSIIETTFYILMPFWLSDSGYGFLEQLYLMLAELLAGISVYYFIDNRSVGGRKILVIILGGMIGMISILTYLFTDILVYSLCIISFLLKVLFTVEMVIMNEGYNTQYRSLGVGVTQTWGKLMGVIWPFIIFPLYYQDQFMPFILYGSSMLFLEFMAITFPFDMTSIELDDTKIYKNQEGFTTFVSETQSN